MHDDLRAGCFLNFSIAADVVRVAVSGDDIFNRHAHLFDLGENFFFIPSRIDHGGLFRLFTCHYIAANCHGSNNNLFYYHRLIVISYLNKVGDTTPRHQPFISNY